MQLTVPEVAQHLNVPEKTVYRWISEGDIPFHRVDGTYRFNPTELVEWANARNLKVSTSIYRDPEGGPAVPTLAEALEAGGILYGITGADKEGVLRSMVEALPLPEDTDREMLFALVLAREKLGSTAIGKGIAIPHVRNPMILKVASARITLCFLDRPIDFDSPDRQPVRAMFWLVCPTVRAHTHLLARLAALVRDPAFQEALARRAGREEILQAARRVEAALGPAAR